MTFEEYYKNLGWKLVLLDKDNNNIENVVLDEEEKQKKTLE